MSIKVPSKSISLHFLLLASLAYYLTACAVADLIHNHEPDFNFHYDCPACQWQIMHQDDFSGADEILDNLNDPLHLIVYEYYIQSIVLPSESHRFSSLSRAPPQPV